MTPEGISFVISQCYGVPSVALYILTIVIILRDRKAFSSSFFVLYIYDGSINLFTYLNTFLILRLNTVTCKQCFFAPFYENIGSVIPISFINTMGFHMAYVQYAITTLVSFNRLSVLLNYNLMEPIWKRYTWLFILTIFAAPFIATHTIFNYEGKLTYLNESEYYTFEGEGLPRADVIAVLIPFTVVATSLSVVINISSILIVHNLKTQIRNKAETNFLIIMSITCLVQLLGTAITVALSTLEMSPFLMKLVYALPYVSDGLTLVQPWLLVCFSHAIRNRVKWLFGWQPKSVATSNQLIQIRSVTS